MRVSTSLVDVPVVVTDRGGRYVTDLRREDFRVFEDGVEQQVAFFEPVEESSDSAGRNRALVRPAGGGGPGASPTLMSRRVPHELGSEYLYELADRMGARALSAKTGASLAKALAEVAEELRRQYSVSYYPAPPPPAGGGK